jgi:hypothetical protein
VEPLIFEDSTTKEINMFQRIKTFFSGVGIVFKYGDIIGGVVSAWNSYPGLDDSEKIRRWIKPLLLDASTLALLTKTPIDDTIVIGAVRIVDHDRAWAAVHSLALLARDGGLFKDGILVPESAAYQSQLDEINAASKEIAPGCPILIHAAVGLILFLLQQRISRK